MVKFKKNIRYKFNLVLVFSLITCFGASAQRQSAIVLWPNGTPGANPTGGEEIVRIDESSGDHVISNIHEPTTTPYFPKSGTASGVAVIIAPGGGHREIWSDHEGHNVAQRLADSGIATFVLKYRLARDENSTYTVENHSVKDMLRAIRVVRKRASEWKIDPKKIGIMGFSAGGQVAALTDISADSGNVRDQDPVETVCRKPNFQVLIYPAWVNDITSFLKFFTCIHIGGIARYGKYINGHA